MKDIIEELRSKAHSLVIQGDSAPYDPSLAALLTNAAAEIERLRKTLQEAHGQLAPDQSFSVMVKDLKHYLRGETDG